MRRGFWFVAGAGAGVYVMVRTRRAVEAFTPEGLRDRVAGLGVGAHLFAEEVRAGTIERETELRERLGLSVDGTLQLESRPAPTTGFETLAGMVPEEVAQQPSRRTRSSTTESLEGTH